jgi:hypothetical protein
MISDAFVDLTSAQQSCVDMMKVSTRLQILTGLPLEMGLLILQGMKLL